MIYLDEHIVLVRWYKTLNCKLKPNWKSYRNI